MATQEFSVGEWVQRRIDGAVGVVKKVQPYGDDFAFYVDLDPNRRVPATDNDLWAGTTQAWRRHFRLHAHVDTQSRDCDGTYSGGHVVEMTLEERCDGFGDYRFRDRVVANVISLHGHGTLKVTPEGVEWHEETEEGFRAADVRWCSDDCSHERAWQRDHRAEEMGY